MKKYSDKDMARPRRVLVGGGADALHPQILTRLEREGYRLETVREGAAVAAALQAGRADVALIDVLTPGKNGIQILTETRETGIPVILFSAHTGVRLAVEAMKLGAADYLLQPLQIGELLESLRTSMVEEPPDARDGDLEAEEAAKTNHARKLESLGRVTAAVAHDLNNQTTVVLGYSEILLNQEPLNSAIRAHLEEIRRAAWRSAGLTRQLLAFGRKQPVDLEVFDLNTLVSGMQQMLQLIVGEKIKLSLRLDAASALMSGNVGQIEQVLVNLVLNARDAMPRGGRLGITTANVVLEGSADAEPHVMLAVSDTGMGMDSETRSQLFVPFFTTKGPGKGTGLGLTVVKQTVDQCGGQIDVVSRPGEGSTFTLYFPESILKKDHQPHAAFGSRPISQGTETVLLAEDDDGVRSMIRTFLLRHGYEVLEARNGREVVEISENHEGAIHLLLSDIVMPDFDGPDLAEQVTLRHPGLRVLFISGYAEPVLVERGLSNGHTHFLQKPFTTEALAGKIRDTLDTWN
jgi:two-component system cell cycle sensor histidine kinase/response regulator CckA